MQWNAAIGAIARCKVMSIAYARKGRSVHALRWTCGVKPKPRGVNKPSKHYMMRVQDEQNPVSLLQSPKLCLFSFSYFCMFIHLNFYNSKSSYIQKYIGRLHDY